MTGDELIALLRALPAEHRALQLVFNSERGFQGIGRPEVVDDEPEYEAPEDRWHRLYDPAHPSKQRRLIIQL